MADAVVGSVAVEIVPSAASFPAKLAAKVEPAAKALGEKIGKALANKIAESIAEGLGKGFAGSEPIARKKGADAGSGFGGEFGRKARERIEAALAAIPDQGIGVSTSKADQKIKDLRFELATLRDQRINVDISEAEFFSELTRIQTALTVLGSESVHVQVKMDTAKAALELGTFGAAVKTFTGGGGKGSGLAKVTSLADEAGKAFGPLIGIMSSAPVIIGALATALIPLTAALVGVTAALLAPLAAAGGGITLFAILAGKAIGNTSKIAKQIDELKKKADTLTDPKAAANARAQAKALGDSLTGPQKAFIKARSALSESFNKLLGGKTGDALFKPIVAGMNLLAKILPALSPVIQSVSGAISDMLDSITKKASGSGFKSFIDSFAKLAGSSLRSIGSIIGGVTSALGGLFKAGSGTGTSALDSIANAAQRLGTYLNSDKGQAKLKAFFEYVREKGPGIAKSFIDIVAKVGKLLHDLEPFGRVVLNVVSAVVGYIADTLVPNLKNGATAIGAVFAGIQHAIGSAVQFVLRSFANLLSGFANVLGALGHVPGFSWAKKASVAMDAAAGAARQLADGINQVPKKINIVAKAQTAAAQKAIDKLNAATRSAGAGVHYSNGYGGGQTAYAVGGWVRGPGSGTSDSIDARLSNGEFVVNAKAAAQYGNLLTAINDGKGAGGVGAAVHGQTSLSIDYDQMAAAFARNPVVVNAGLSVGSRQFALAVQDANQTIGKNA